MKKNKGGRPKWIPTAQNIQDVEEMAARGMTEYQIASALGISQETLIQRKKEFTEFSESIKRGKIKGLQQITGALFKSALEGNTTAQIFYLKTQCQWKETTVNELTGKDGKAIEHEVKSKISVDLINTRISDLLDK